MKGKDLQKVADKYLQSLEKYCRRVPGSFTIEDIHDLRVDYKRLRAFTRLCREEAQASNLQIPESLRDIYKAAGVVRDHQLFLPKARFPEFTKCLQQELFKAKELLVKNIEKADWDKIGKSIKGQLPNVLHDVAIRQFVNRKVAAIHILQLAASREEDLHDVRKNLKDLIHVNRIFEHDWMIPFPFPAWKNISSLNATAEKLGDFNDECITLAFLQSSCISPGESEDIAAWRNIQTQQVEAGKQKLLQAIQKLNLTAQSTPVK